MNIFMNQAIKEAFKGIKRGHGAAFGAVIVRNGKVISKGHSTVLKDRDATCHAEMNAIRKACKKLKRFDLTDCEIYTTGQPCKMCEGAINWAKIKRVYFGNTYREAKEMGFDDENGNNRDVKVSRIDSEYTVNLVEQWNNTKKRKIY